MHKDPISRKQIHMHLPGQMGAITLLEELLLLLLVCWVEHHFPRWPLLCNRCPVTLRRRLLRSHTLISWYPLLSPYFFLSLLPSIKYTSHQIANNHFLRSSHLCDKTQSFICSILTVAIDHYRSRKAFLLYRWIRMICAGIVRSPINLDYVEFSSTSFRLALRDRAEDNHWFEAIDQPWSRVDRSRGSSDRFRLLIARAVARGRRRANETEQPRPEDTQRALLKPPLQPAHARVLRLPSARDVRRCQAHVNRSIARNTSASALMISRFPPLSMLPVISPLLGPRTWCCVGCCGSYGGNW